MDPSNLMSAAKAGMRFDYASILLKPQIILRMISLLFSIIVFGCISSGGRVNKICLYDKDSNACSYATGIGVIAFLASILFIITDIVFDKVSNIKSRKHIILADLAFSGLWTFLWFVSFCYLTNKWSNTSGDWLKAVHVKSWKLSNVRSAIAFSLFSMAVWGGITFFAIKRFRSGMQGSFEAASTIEQEVDAANGGVPGDPTMGGAAPYSAYPGVDSMGDLGTNYHETPFNSSGMGGQQYYPASY